MRRIRVLRVIARMNVGGPALQVAGLARGLDPEVFDHRLLAGSVEEGEADYLELRAPDVPVQRVPGLGRSLRPGDDLRAFASILRTIREFRPDVVHTHTAKAGVLGRVAARTAGVNCIVHTFHGHLLHGYFSPAGTAAVRTVERAAARMSTRLLAVGEQVRDDLLAAGIGRPDQYTVVPPGVALPPPPPRAQARRALGLPSDAPVVAFVARLTAVKRPDRMLDTVRILRRQVPDALVVVAGEGPLLEQMRAAAADDRDHVRFLGWRPDVETVYAAADVALLTSDNEGMPVSLIEAAMCGTPAVTTRVGSAGEVVLDGVSGFVTDSVPAVMAAALVRLLQDPDRRARFSGAARAHAISRFGVERLVDDMSKLYRDLADGTSR